MRAAGLISAIVVFLLVTVFMTLQSFQSSGDQQASQLVGASEYSVQTLSRISLGESGLEIDNLLRAAALQAGATNPVIHDTNTDGFTVGDTMATSAIFEEANWGAVPFPHRFFEHDGRWPRTVHEVTVSSPLAKTHPIGSTISLFDGNFTATVVGVVKDDFSRYTSTLFTLAGTWNSLADIDDKIADRYDATALRTMYWTGGDPSLVVTAISAVLLKTDATLTANALLPQVNSKSALTSRGSSPLIEFMLASLIAPFLAALIGTILATRFINRIRTVMLAVGIARRATRSRALRALTVSLAIGLAIGIGAGAALGFAVRPLMNLMSERAIGPVHDLAIMALSLVIASLLGGGLGLLLNSVRQSQSSRASVRANRSP